MREKERSKMKIRAVERIRLIEAGGLKKPPVFGSKLYVYYKMRRRLMIGGKIGLEGWREFRRGKDAKKRENSRELFHFEKEIQGKGGLESCCHSDDTSPEDGNPYVAGRRRRFI